MSQGHLFHLLHPKNSVDVLLKTGEVRKKEPRNPAEE
jgi:hypothetical protein